MTENTIVPVCFPRLTLIPRLSANHHHPRSGFISGSFFPGSVGSRPVNPAASSLHRVSLGSAYPCLLHQRKVRTAAKRSASKPFIHSHNIAVRSAQNSAAFSPLSSSMMLCQYCSDIQYRKGHAVESRKFGKPTFRQRAPPEGIKLGKVTGFEFPSTAHKTTRKKARNAQHVAGFLTHRWIGKTVPPTTAAKPRCGAVKETPFRK